MIYHFKKQQHPAHKIAGIPSFAGVWFPFKLSATVDTNTLRKPNRFILSNVIGNFEGITISSKKILLDKISKE